MKVYKDILEYLKIDSVYIRIDGTNYFSVPLEMNEDYWVLAMDEMKDIKGDGILYILTKNGNFEIPIGIEKFNDNKYSIYTCIHKASFYIDNLKEEDKVFLEEVKKVENETSKWNKRKEERFTIKEDIEGIGFDSPEQQLITMEDTFPCFVTNVSYSGSQVITYQSYMPVGKVICLNFGFKNPIERILIKAIVRHYQEIKGNEKKLAIVSMEFDHAPLSWQHRMNRLVEHINNKK